MRAVYWKELTDHFGSFRFIVFFVIICLTALFATYTASETIRDNIGQDPTESVFLRLFTTSGDTLPSFLWFISFFGPLLGIIFGFDAINSERSRGTLSNLLSQPVYRDSVINGKFLAGLTAIAIILAGIILMVCGIGLRMIGIVPDAGEIGRIVAFYIISLLYVGFWLALGILFSVLFRRVIVSALCTISIWIICALFMSMIAGSIADWVHPIERDANAEVILANEDTEKDVERISPVYLFQEASDTLLTPEKGTLRGLVMVSEVQGMIPGSVSMNQSLRLVWPHWVGLFAATLVCFAVSYVKFMREEIRAT